MRILQFSGGKDSLACLLLYWDQLDNITVMWGSSGDSFPETIAQMEKVKKTVPHFIEVKGNQPEVIQQLGYPVDVLPLRNYPAYQSMIQQDRLKLNGFIECCYSSFLKKCQDKCAELGATEIIRGQKRCDAQKSAIKNGDVVDGILYTMPIEEWTDAEVMDYVKDSPYLSEHYRSTDGRTGLDCLHCTAHLFENTWKMKYLETHHSAVAEEVKRRLRLIKREIDSDMQYMEMIIGGK